METLVDADKVAEYLGIKKVTVWDMVRNKKIPFILIGTRRYKFDLDTIKQWARNQTTNQPN